MRIDLEHRNREPVGYAAGSLPLLGGIRWAAADDGEHPLGPERVERHAGEVGRVDTAAEADEDGALRDEPRAELALLVGGDVGRTAASGVESTVRWLRALL